MDWSVVAFAISDSKGFFYVRPIGCYWLMMEDNCTLKAKIGKFDQKPKNFWKNSLAFGKEKGFMNLPKLSEIDLRLTHGVFNLPGARDKFRRSIRYTFLGKFVPHTNGNTFLWLNGPCGIIMSVLSWQNWCPQKWSLFNFATLEGFGWKNFPQTNSPIFTEKFPVYWENSWYSILLFIFSAVNKFRQDTGRE